jgi:protein dithiol:quinone oxidoreductase
MTRSLFASYPLRSWFAALAVGNLGLVTVGLGLQQVFSLAACPMCIFQRLLYLLLALLALGGVVVPLRARWWGGLLATVSLLGCGVASYQSWMQAFPDPANECSYSDPSLLERIVDWFGMRWPDLFMATGFCSSKEWVFAGLSMANYSVFCFAVTAAFGGFLVRQRLLAKPY